MNLQQLRVFINESARKHPHLKSEMHDLYWLCVSEIEEGGSPDHEIQLCFNDIEQLIEQESV